MVLGPLTFAFDGSSFLSRNTADLENGSLPFSTIVTLNSPPPPPCANTIRPKETVLYYRTNRVSLILVGMKRKKSAWRASSGLRDWFTNAERHQDFPEMGGFHFHEETCTVVTYERVYYEATSRFWRLPRSLASLSLRQFASLTLTPDDSISASCSSRSI